MSIFGAHKVIFGDVDDIVVKSGGFILPHYLEDDRIWKTVDSFYGMVAHTPRLDTILTQKLKEYYTDLLMKMADADQDELTGLLTLIVKDELPPHIRSSFSIKVTNLGASCYVKCTLSYDKLDKYTSPVSITVQIYGILDETSGSYIPTHDSKVKQQITKQINSQQDSMTVEKFLSNSSLSTFGGFGTKYVSNEKFSLGSFFNVSKLSNSSVDKMFVIPKCEVSKKYVRIGGFALGQGMTGYSSNMKPVNETCLTEHKEKPIYGAKLEKGVWKASQDKNCIVPMSREEAIDELTSFLNGTGDNILLKHFFNVLISHGPFYVLEQKNEFSETKDLAYMIYCDGVKVYVVGDYKMSEQGKYIFTQHERSCRKVYGIPSEFLDKCNLLFQLMG